MKKSFIIIPVSMFFIILISSLLISTYDKSFYISQFKINNTYENSLVIDRNINPETIADEVIGYLKNDFDNLNKNNHYTNEEIIHMKDVKDLFLIAKYSMYVFIILLLLLSILYIKKTKSIIKFFNKLIKYFLIFTLVVFLLLFIAFLNFSNSFTAFHEMLFTNDYWLLDESSSIIINIMPQEFFMAHVKNIGKLFLMISLTLIICLKLIGFIINRRK